MRRLLYPQSITAGCITFPLSGWRKWSHLFFASIFQKLELAESRPHGPARPVIIVLADDDEDDREMFEEAITRINPAIQIKTFASGSSLFRYLEKGEQPALIFLDLNMPGKNGMECLAEIRKSSDWSGIPVVIYSTSSNNNDIRETYTKGANLYLLKPNSFSVLMKLIERAFRIDLDDRVSQKDFVLNNNG